MQSSRMAYIYTIERVGKVIPYVYIVNDLSIFFPLVVDLIMATS